MIHKRALVRQYKQNPPEMGVYKITNRVNGKIFVGSAKNIAGIINSNRFQLKMGSHYIQELQEDYKKYGEENFTFEKIDTLELRDDINYDYTEDLAALEELWLERLQPYDDRGYNSRKL